MEQVTLVLSIVAIILTTITSIFSFKAYASVVGLQNSTHQVAYMPIDPPTPKGDNDKESEEQTPSSLLEGIRSMYPDLDEEQV